MANMTATDHSDELIRAVEELRCIAYSAIRAGVHIEWSFEIENHFSRSDDGTPGKTLIRVQGGFDPPSINVSTFVRPTNRHRSVD